jgi:1,4-alpha-glucan branching enzyme
MEMPRKAYSKDGKSCRVTFYLPAEVSAEWANLCGEFNQWDRKSHPMRKRKDGGFWITIGLKLGESYRYRFLINGESWENDWSTDRYVPNPYGGEDSVVEV